MSLYSLGQWLQPWILPPGLNFVIAFIGYIISHFSKYIGNTFIAIAIISLWCFCTPITAQFFIDTLQNRFPRLITNNIKSKEASAIIVLGGGSWFNKHAKKGYSLSPATKDRLTYAAYLYRQTHIPIFISGGGAEKKAMEAYFNVPVTWHEYQSLNTLDESYYTLPILQKNNIKTIYLVTNAWHMPRAMYSFEQIYKNKKINIIPAPMGYILNSDNGIKPYLPSFKALRVSKTAMHEYVGLMAYYLGNL